MLFPIRTALLGISLPLIQASPFPTSVLSDSHLVKRDEPLPTAAPISIDNIDALYQDIYVVTLVNSHTAAITTAHTGNVGSPAALYDGNSFLEAGSTAIFAVPTGWAGRVAMAEAGYPIYDRASLLEGSFMVPDGFTKGRIALDVSYVDGFTVPIACECRGEVVLGCNLNLLDMCPDEYRIDAGTCMNPLRDGGSLAYNFFNECAGLSYTFPRDDLATVYGIEGCETRIQCCVGTACAPHPRQVLCPAADGSPQLCSSMYPGNYTAKRV